MARTFVAINDPVHTLLRDITRHLPLTPNPAASGGVGIEYDVKLEALPEAYYSLAVFHALAGMALESVPLTRWRVRPQDKPRIPQRVNFFDVINLDRRCARDLRLKSRKRGPGMLAGELLAFGTGTLRARNDDPAEPLHHRLWSQYGRIQTRHEVVYAAIRALHRNSQSGSQQLQKESFDSTNVIYGDAFGEIEQLWDRRADTDFLELVARSLQAFGRRAAFAPFLHPPLNLPGLRKLHLNSQAVWKRPPATARGLLRRIEYLLVNTVVDAFPRTVFRHRRPHPHPQAGASAPQPTGWEADRSGYDGWLKDGREEPPAPGW